MEGESHTQGSRSFSVPGVPGDGEYEFGILDVSPGCRYGLRVGVPDW